MQNHKRKTSILKFSQKDFLEISELHLKLFSEIGETTQSTKQFRDPSVLGYLSKINKHVVGYITFRMVNGAVFINWFGVLPKYQQKGIGRSLLGAVNQYCVKERVKWITLETRNRYKKAISLYLSEGFDLVGMSQGTDKDLMIRLRKEL